MTAPVSRHLILFAPGAGAPSSHSWMQNWKKRLSQIGVVETFDYMRTGGSRQPLEQGGGSTPRSTQVLCEGRLRGSIALNSCGPDL